ncbi:hypothetical protein PILCRDRAFT_829091 [Piloderma croceum F 1598]|uniref:Uncharacterized protein n=1 Tax=Piloderma croceum (strain F 1598) TaxID=765440 RepID=A0A0C3F004_PILCF|nr:hypothetical protein PILCRDRAFT_829091 [Piloderma croceum F 1598]
MDMYPSHRTLPTEAEEVARQSLHVFMMECLRLRSGSRAPFSLGECRELLDYLDKPSTPITPSVDGTAAPFSSMFVESTARTHLISWILLHAAYHNKATEYGMKTYSEYLTRSLHVRAHSHSMWFMVLSFLCFGVSFIHRRHINVAQQNSELRGDQKTWPVYIESLVREWSTFNLAATVLLSSVFAFICHELRFYLSSRASVSFLAVTGIDNATRIATLLSVVMTLGSIMIGIYALWRHQGGVEYNMSLVKTSFQGDVLAVILSIPFVLLAWGVITFLLAIVLYSFLGFQTTPSGNIVLISRETSILTLVFSLIVVCLLVLSMSFFRVFRLTN